MKLFPKLTKAYKAGMRPPKVYVCNRIGVPCHDAGKNGKCTLPKYPKGENCGTWGVLRVSCEE